MSRPDSHDPGAPDREGLHRSAPSPQEQRVLLERAHRLAALPAVPERDLLELLVFGVGGEQAALELSSLRGVLRPALTPVPDVRPEVLGIQGVRGEVVGVLALHRLLDLPEDPSSERARVLLVQTPRGPVGWWVGMVEDTRRIGAAHLRSGTGGRAGVRGVLEGKILLLDPAGVVARLGQEG